jgi:hypothetical protein
MIAGRPGIAVFDIFSDRRGVIVLASAGSAARPCLEVRDFAMTDASDDDARDSLNAEKAPKLPAPPKLKPKTHPGAPATKAQKAALMRADKMVIKRMRKK